MVASFSEQIKFSLCPTRTVFRKSPKMTRTFKPKNPDTLKVTIKNKTIKREFLKMKCRFFCVGTSYIQ
jgi:hypothetical protein